MILFNYADLIAKHTPNKLLERSWLLHIPMSTYHTPSESRFIDIHEVISSLYEEKLVSYVRTTANILSVEQFDDRFSILDAIASSHYHDKSIMKLLVNIDINHMKSGYWLTHHNAAHSAITPTAVSIDMISYFKPSVRPYDELRREIYIDICKSYINLFIPD